MSYAQNTKRKFKQHYKDLQNSVLFRSFVGGVRQTLSERITKIAFSVLLLIVAMGLVGPTVAPYEPDAVHYSESGELLRTASPSSDHLLGTTSRGEDVLSKLLYGARPTLLVGFVGGFLMLTIGMFVGIVSGYVGGTTESVLMRFTDFMYGVPFLPFAIVLLTFLEAGFTATVLVIGLILWRGWARVIRAQVLQIKERPYIMAAEATGASSTRIIVRHILPNVGSMAALIFSMGVGIAIIKQAGLAFLGVTNPFLPSWGIMIRNAFNSGSLADAWWWSFPPGILISMTVLSLYIIGRGYENVGDSGEIMG